MVTDNYFDKIFSYLFCITYKYIVHPMYMPTGFGLCSCLGTIESDHLTPYTYVIYSNILYCFFI